MWHVTPAEKLSLEPQSVFRLLFSSVEEGSSRSGGVGTDSRVGDVASVDGGEDTTVDDVLGVGHHGGGLGPLDDWLAGNGSGHVHIVGGIHVDGGGHLHDVLLVDGHVVGHLNATLNKDGVLHLVHLNLLLDDGGVVGEGSLEHGGDGDGEMGGGGLEDPGGVAGDKAGLTKVHLLGHHGGGLVHGGHALGLGGGGEGSRGWGRHVVDGVGHHGAGGVVVGTGGGRSHGVGGGSHSVGGDPVAGGGGHPGDGVSQLGPGTGAGQDEGECDKRPHADGDLPLSC